MDLKIVGKKHVVVYNVTQIFLCHIVLTQMCKYMELESRPILQGLNYGNWDLIMVL